MIAFKPLGAKPASLALVALAAVTLALLVGLAVADLAGESLIEARQRAVAATARDYFVAFAHAEGLKPFTQALDQRAQHQVGAFRYAVFDNAGRRLGGDDLLTMEQMPPPGFSTVHAGAGDEEADYDVLVQPMSVGGTLAIYENLADRTAFRWAIMGAVAAAMLCSLAIVAAASIWLGGLMVRRARGIADAADRIAGGDLSARAPVGAADDAFDHIAVALNAMLARIEALMTGMQSVTDSLAHDLRSPLTRLRAALSEALAPEADETRRLDLIETAHGECERVLATFGALLDIARAESGVSREMLAPLDAAATVAEVAELLAPVVEDAGQTLTVRTPPEPVTMSGHDLLLRQALGNLLHNAVRYAGAGARIELALEEDAESVRFVVADDGPGVPAEARDRVQERFVRLDASRSSPGSGLGLAIAAACAKLHDGRLTLEDNGPGLRATLIASRGSPPGGAFNKL